MKITSILFSIIALSLFSCGDPNNIEVSEANFSYKPLSHWKVGFESYEFAPADYWKIYSAVYEIKSKKSDTTIAVVSVHAEHLKYRALSCESLDIYDEDYDKASPVFSLKKAFQKKYGLKDPEKCTLISTDKVLYCDNEMNIRLDFQIGDIWIICRITSSHLPESELYDENLLVNEFDQFIRSIKEL